MQTRLRMVLLLATVLVTVAVPAHAWGGFHHFHHFGGSRVFIAPRIVVPFGPFWAPYPYPRVIVPPPVYVQPAPQVYVQPSPPPTYWYYCDNPRGYYPYVHQCPGGWKQVVPSPPQ